MPGRKPAGIAQAQAAQRPEPPRPFVGHASLVERFRRLGPARLAHAYLFYGPQGVGKKTFARTLALTLHCERPDSFPLGYDGTCTACKRGLAGSDADTLLVDAAFIASLDPDSERKIAGVNVDVAREVVRLMQLRSYEGGRQICIIPHFDAITYDYVYNAFLKELEEPDPGKIFLLTSDRPERILPTVRSRTSPVRFGALSPQEIAGALVEQYGVIPARAQALARRAQGSLGDAIAMRDDDGAAFGEGVRDWALACLQHPRALPPMPQLDKDDPRSSLSAVLRSARSTLRDCMVFAAAGDDALFDVEAKAHYRAACAALGPDAAAKTARALALVGEAERLATTNIAPSAVFGWLQVQLRTVAGER